MARVVYARVNFNVGDEMREEYYYLTFDKRDGVCQEPTFKNTDEEDASYNLEDGYYF